MKKHILVTGVGPGTGAAIVRRFANAGYKVSMIARNAERLAQLEKSLPDVAGYAVDVTDSGAFLSMLDRICDERGSPGIVVHNAVDGVFGTYAEIDPGDLKVSFDTNVMALLHLARRLLPAMIDAGDGVLVVTGNTSAVRGKARFAGLAPTKAAQRILTESIAREVGPAGIHVAYALIDAVIDVEWTRRLRPDASDDFFVRPNDIADEIFHVVHQPRSAWSFNVEMRPFGEVW